MRQRSEVLMLMLVIGAIATACANRAQETGFAAQTVAGCYETQLWPGESGAEADAKRARLKIPPLIRLASDPMTEWPVLNRRYGEDVYRAYSWGDGRWRDHPFNYWRPVGEDSIYAGHPGALAGAGLSLAAVDDGFEGVIVTHTDVLQPGDTVGARGSAPIALRRVDCPNDR